MANVNNEGIPFELKALKQWVCWRYEQNQSDPTKKPTKVPYTPVTGRRASSIDPFHWSTFDDAIRALNAHGYDGVGFVLSKDDPYCVIDLDAATTQEEYDLINSTYANAQSFTEISPSGSGLHVWMKASVPRGRKKHPIEIYSCARFITVTGNVQWNIPIEYRQEYADAIYASMPSSISDTLSDYDGLDEPAGTDQEIVNRAFQAANGLKFADLWRGDWQQHYSSQSEADLALVNIIAFYTQNTEQILRLYRFSALGQREKAYSDYHTRRLIRLCFDRMPPKQLLDQMKANVEALIASTQKYKQQEDIADAELIMPANVQVLPDVPVVTSQTTAYSASHVTEHSARLLTFEELNFPQGLVGEIAYFLYCASPRPVREVSLAGAIGILAGLCGSAYNISASGLNQYICVLAATGTGKDALGAPLDYLIRSVAATAPAATKFFGSGNFASPQGLLRMLSEESRSMLATVGECGLWLSTLSNPKIKDKHTTELRRTLLDLYGKSGAHGSYRGAVYSDKKNNIKPIRAPALTLLGDATPSSFFEDVDERLIAEGFIPRWLLIEYTGKRPMMNESHAKHFPPQNVVNTLSLMVNYISKQMEKFNVHNVAFDEVTQDLARKFNAFCDEQYNAAKSSTIQQIWTRVHMKALRLAALFAVGKNYLTPVIDRADWEYAVSMVIADANALIRRYNNGELQEKAFVDDYRQQQEARNAILDYLHCDVEKLKSYGVTQIMRDNIVIPLTFFSRKLIRKAAFTSDRRGATTALKYTIKDLVQQGILAEVVDAKIKATLGYSGQCYIIANTELLQEHD